MRIMFSTAAALALWLVAAVAMGQEGGRDPSPSALQPGAQQPAAQTPAPQEATQPVPPTILETETPALGADSAQPNLTEPTSVEKRLDNGAERQRGIDRADALNDRRLPRES